MFGSRIRNKVREALELEIPDWARTTLEWSISKDVFKGNASGPTKRAVVEVLAQFYGEDFKPNKPARERKPKKLAPSPEHLMQRCRIVLRQVADADKSEVICNMMEGPNGRKLRAMVARPLDFRTIDARLAAGAYGGSPDAFAADVRQIWRNVEIVHKSGSDMVELATSLSHLFENLYNKQNLVEDMDGPSSVRPQHKLRVISLIKGVLESNGKPSNSNKDVNLPEGHMLEMPTHTGTEIPEKPVDGKLLKARWEDDETCRMCGVDEDYESIMLCDGCDSQYHTYCLLPPLEKVPDGNWFCPACVAVEKGFPEAPAVVAEGEVAGTGKEGERLPGGLELEDEQFHNHGITGDCAVGKDKALHGGQVPVVEGSVQALLKRMKEKEYWHLSLTDRVFLLKFLCDEALNTLQVRMHLEKSVDLACELQQQLRTLVASQQRDVEAARGERQQAVLADQRKHGGQGKVSDREVRQHRQIMSTSSGPNSQANDQDEVTLDTWATRLRRRHFEAGTGIVSPGLSQVLKDEATVVHVEDSNGKSGEQPTCEETGIVENLSPVSLQVLQDNSETPVCMEKSQGMSKEKEMCDGVGTVKIDEGLNREGYEVVEAHVSDKNVGTGMSHGSDVVFDHRTTGESQLMGRKSLITSDSLVADSKKRKFSDACVTDGTSEQATVVALQEKGEKVLEGDTGSSIKRLKADNVLEGSKNKCESNADCEGEHVAQVSSLKREGIKLDGVSNLHREEPLSEVFGGKVSERVEEKQPICENIIHLPEVSQGSGETLNHGEECKGLPNISESHGEAFCAVGGEAQVIASSFLQCPTETHQPGLVLNDTSEIGGVNLQCTVERRVDVEGECGLATEETSLSPVTTGTDNITHEIGMSDLKGKLRLSTETPESGRKGLVRSCRSKQSEYASFSGTGGKRATKCEKIADDCLLASMLKRKVEVKALNSRMGSGYGGEKLKKPRREVANSVKFHCNGAENGDVDDLRPEEVEVPMAVADSSLSEDLQSEEALSCYGKSKVVLSEDVEYATLENHGNLKVNEGIAAKANAGDLLDAEIARVEAKLFNASLRRDHLGTDDLGREYWAFGGSDQRPCLVVGKWISASKSQLEEDGKLNRIGDEDELGCQWWAYKGDGSLDALFAWLRPRSRQERALRASLTQWRRSVFTKHQKQHMPGTLNEPIDRHPHALQPELPSKHSTESGYPIEMTAFQKQPARIIAHNFPGMKATAILRRKPGGVLRSKIVTKDGSKTSQLETKLNRCECLEPVWKSRCHCQTCHETFDSSAELQTHQKVCAKAGRPGRKSLERGPSPKLLISKVRRSKGMAGKWAVKGKKSLVVEGRKGTKQSKAGKKKERKSEIGKRRSDRAKWIVNVKTTPTLVGEIEELQADDEENMLVSEEEPELLSVYKESVRAKRLALSMPVEPLTIRGDQDMQDETMDPFFHRDSPPNGIMEGSGDENVSFLTPVEHEWGPNLQSGKSEMKQKKEGLRGGPGKVAKQSLKQTAAEEALASFDYASMPMSFSTPNSTRDRILQIGCFDEQCPTFAPALYCAPAFDPSLMIQPYYMCMDRIPSIDNDVFSFTSPPLSHVVSPSQEPEPVKEFDLQKLKIISSSADQHSGKQQVELHATPEGEEEVVDVGTCWGNRWDLVASLPPLASHASRKSLEEAEGKDPGSYTVGEVATVTGDTLPSDSLQVSGIEGIQRGFQSTISELPCEPEKDMPVAGVGKKPKKFPVSEASLRPLVGEQQGILRGIQIRLLDIEAAMARDVLEPVRSSSGRRRAWRSLVKSAKCIYEVTKAIILLEQMVRADCLKTSWCYWSSLSAAARSVTLSSVALKLYALDAAIIYREKSLLVMKMKVIAQ